MTTMKRPDEAFIELLKRSGSADKNEALAAQRELAKAIELPLREGVLVGNILDGIFEAIPMEPGTTTEFPLDRLHQSRPWSYSRTCRRRRLRNGSNLQYYLFD